MINNVVASMSAVLINALSAAAIVGFVGFILRGVLSRWIGEKISERTQKRLSEFEAKLSAEQAKVSDLRQFVISGKLRRHDALLEKQIQSADALWDALISDKRHSFLVQVMQTLDVEKINELIASGDHTETVEFVSSTTGLDRFIEDAQEQENQTERQIARKAELSRPFVSPLAWAYYSAFRSICMHAVVTMLAWKSGMDTKILKNHQLMEAVSRALPHQKGFIEEYGASATYFLIEELEEKLLQELRRFVRDGETDQELVDQASGILAAVNEQKQKPTST